MSPTEQKVIDEIKAVFTNKGLAAPEITPRSPIDLSLGLESLDFAELAVRLEMAFGRDPFSESTVPPLRVVADLAALYEAERAPRRD